MVVIRKKVYYVIAIFSDSLESVQLILRSNSYGFHETIICYSVVIIKSCWIKQVNDYYMIFQNVIIHVLKNMTLNV